MIPFVDLKAQYPSIKTEVDAAIHGRPGHLPVHARQRSRGVREGVRRLLAGQARHRREQRHQRAAPGAARRRHRRQATKSSPCRSPSWPPSRRSTTRGATPVFVDIDPRTFTMDPAKIEAAITPRTKAIMPGAPVRPDAPTWTRSWRSRRSTSSIVIEDACQAHGAEYKGRRAGSIGDMGCFSFYPGQEPRRVRRRRHGRRPATPSTTRTIRMLRDWGAEKKYQHVLKGYNYRLEGIQGAVLRVKLQATSKAGPRRAAPRPRTTTQLLRRQRRADARGAARTAGTSITSTPSARPTAPQWQDALQAQGIADRHPLPDPGAPAARLRRPRLQGRPVPALRARGGRGAVAADVPGADRGAVPTRGRGGEGAGDATPSPPINRQDVAADADRC